MVADVDCCYCPTCQAVCTGKFPACSKVWARGPQSVTFRAKELGPGGAPVWSANANANSNSYANGNGHATPPRNGSTANGSTNGSTNGSYGTDARYLPPALPPGQPPELAALLEEIRSIRRHLEQTNTTNVGDGEDKDLQAYFAATNTLLETLPARIAAAIGETLTKQHQMIVKDIEASLRQFAGRLARITPPPR
jgi:hypothetical protein